MANDNGPAIARKAAADIQNAHMASRLGATVGAAAPSMGLATAGEAAGKIVPPITGSPREATDE